MSKRFLIVLLAVSAVFMGLLITNKKEDTQSGTKTNEATLSQNIFGKADAKVQLVEYGDFQCPACGAFFPVIREVKELYKDKISFQFRHYPLSEIHQNAVISSRAAEAAGKQGKFWEMHDKLYENQAAWESTTSPNQFFEAYAQEIGLNMEQFKTDIKSAETNAIVQADRAEARKQGFSSTPTFVLNGKKLDNPPGTVEEFSKLIDQALKENQ